MGIECSGLLQSCGSLVMAFGCSRPCAESVRLYPSRVVDCPSFVRLWALVRMVLQNVVHIDSVAKCCGLDYAGVYWAWFCS